MIDPETVNAELRKALSPDELKNEGIPPEPPEKSVGHIALRDPVELGWDWFEGMPDGD